MFSYKPSGRIWRLTCPTSFEQWAQADYSGRIVWPSINTPLGELKYEEWAEIEWMKQGKGLADFTWPHGFYGWLHIVVRENVGKELIEKFCGAHLLGLRQHNVQVVAEEVDLRILWVEHRTHVNANWSTWRMEKSMSGRKLRVFEGIEKLEYDFGDPNDDPRELIHTTRDPNRGIFIEEQCIAGFDFFRTWEWPGAYLCTDAVKDYVTERKLTNITFLDVGNIISK